MTLSQDITTVVIIIEANRRCSSLRGTKQSRVFCFWIASYLAMTKIFRSESSYKCAIFEKCHYKERNDGQR
jgi:hypothetical protein